MNEQTSLPEVSFRPGFAAGVLDRAEKIARNRRRWSMTGVAAAAVSIVATGLWSVPSSRQPAVRAAAPPVQIVNAGAFSWIDEAGQSDPLQWMFPDAQPVVQFADNYSNSMLGGATQRQQMLFADASDRDLP